MIREKNSKKKELIDNEERDSESVDKIMTMLYNID